MVENEIILIKEVYDLKHAEKLASLVNEVCLFAHQHSLKIEAFCINSGPGSYTGLRIGVSFAKGFCFASNTYLISVTHDEVILWNLINNSLTNQTDFIIINVDSREGEVFAAVYESRGKEIIQMQPIIISEGKLDMFFERGRVLCVGNGNEKLKLKYEYNKNFIYLKLEFSMNAMALLATQKFNLKNYVNLADFEPNYVKPAFINLKN